MQRRGYRPDHVVADEHREHENRQPEYEWIDGICYGFHFDLRQVFGMKFGCTTAPSRVSMVPLMISSSQLTASFFSFLSIMVSRNVSKFLAYSAEADAASRPGMLR